MNGIEFDVMWWKEDQATLADLGMRPDVTEATTRKVTFYIIDSIAPYFEGDHEFTTIRSNNEHFILPLKYEDVKERLKNFKQQ